MSRLCIFMEGGMISAIVTDDPELAKNLTVLTVDYDAAEGGYPTDDDDVIEVPQANGDTAPAYFSAGKPELNDGARGDPKLADIEKLIEAKSSMFRNFYHCPRCEHEWTDEWSATCDIDCPECGCRHISPYKSEDVE